MGRFFGGGARPLARATTSDGQVVLVTRHDLVVQDDQGQEVRRAPWHLVDAGSMTDQGVLRVGLVGEDGPEPMLVLPVGLEAGQLPEAFYERVQASVVLAEDVDAGPAGRAQVAIRKDLRTGELVEQVVLSTKADEGSAELWSLVEQARLRLRDETGLPPA